jgi:Protein of unknown function (DUF1559)
MFEFTCSTCGKHVQADETFAGKRVLCPACDAAMTAPASINAAIVAQPKIAQPTTAGTGAFSEGLPPLHHEPRSLRREDVPAVLGGWLPYIIVGVIAVMIIALVVPAVVKARDAAARTGSINNLKQITLAMHGFHDANKRLPFNGTKPAAPKDKTSGSWAWMIVPFVDAGPMFNEMRTDVGLAYLMCPGRGRPNRCTGIGGPGAWTDYFINPFLNDPNGVADAPDAKLTMAGIFDGPSNTIFVGHGQIRPDDYGSTDAIRGFTATIFDGGNPAMCRGNTKVVNARDSADSMPGNWGGPFSQGGLMGMGDGTVRMFPYSMTGGTIVNGVCNQGVFGQFLTPSGNEVGIMIPDE